MTPADLIPILRQDFLDDEDGSVSAVSDRQYRWSTPFLLREIANAQREACRRQDLRHIYDDSTAEICTIAVTAGVATYQLDSRILRIESARLTVPTTGGTPLIHTTVSGLDGAGGFPGWRTWASGVPRYFVIMGKTLRMVPTPSSADSLSLSVWREPLSDPGMNDELEWPGDHRKLCHWVAAQAFLRPDEDTFRAESAKLQMAMFGQAVGAPVSEQARIELLRLPSSLAVSVHRVPRIYTSDAAQDWRYW